MSAAFFVLRAPLLAIESLGPLWEIDPALTQDDLGDDALGQALERTRAQARSVLTAALSDPVVADALRLASADLEHGLRHWRADPDSRRGHSTERTLVNYLIRMSSRPSLFGTFASYSLGEMPSDRARLALADRSRIQVRVRPDPATLSTVVATVAGAAAEDDALVVRRDPGIYEAAGGPRLAVTGASGQAGPRTRIIALRPSPVVRTVLAAAESSVSIGELVAIAGEDARPHVKRLLTDGALEPEAILPSTGGGACAQAVSSLRSLPGGRDAARAVERACRHLADSGQAGAADAAAELERAGVHPSLARRLHADTSRPGDLGLPRSVTQELGRAVELLLRIAPTSEPGPLVRFRREFERRYGTRPVSLLEAVDPDCGVPLDDSREDPPSAPAAVLFDLLERGRASGAAELTEADLSALEAANPHLPLPDAYALYCSLEAPNVAAVDAGHFTVLEPELAGPSGANTLARHCDGDPELERRVRVHLRGEEQCHPDAIFAELVCAPDTDWGLAVTYRPVLREWEVECGSRSGAAPERRIEVADLVLSMEGELVLRSRRMGRRVLVRGSTAMNHRWMSLPAARLLRLLEAQGRARHLKWSWGGLDEAPTLPRISYRRTVLCRRRWNQPLGELTGVAVRASPASYRALQRWRLAHRIPERVAVLGAKGEHVIDLRSPLGADALFTAVRGQDRVRLVEPAAATPVESPSGHHAHLIVVPYVGGLPAVPSEASVAVDSVPLPDRRFPPGSSWLYAKLYGPPSAADRLIVGLVPTLADRCEFERWFFVRYADPDPHIRLRVHGSPKTLWSELLPALHDATAPLLEDGRLQRLVLDTYEREIERFGGLAGVQLMERAAHADSVAVLSVIGGRRSEQSRHLEAAASVAALLCDTGMSVAEREAFCARARDGMLRGGVPRPPTLARDERALRGVVQDTLAALDAEPQTALVAALQQRSCILGPLLVGAPERVVAILAHLQINRLLRRSAGVEELRVYDALARAYGAGRRG